MDLTSAMTLPALLRMTEVVHGNAATGKEQLNERIADMLDSLLEDMMGKRIPFEHEDLHHGGWRTYEIRPNPDQDKADANRLRLMYDLDDIQNLIA